MGHNKAVLVGIFFIVVALSGKHLRLIGIRNHTEAALLESCLLKLIEFFCRSFLTLLSSPFLGSFTFARGANPPCDPTDFCEEANTFCNSYKFCECTPDYIRDPSKG